MLAAATDELVQTSASDQRQDPVETITSELMPLASALRHIARRGPRTLASRSCGVWGRPAWLMGVGSVVSRQPYGRVLILGAWNYPLFLTGVQAAQALAAGNHVVVKPAAGCEQSTARMIQAFHQSGVPESALIQIDSSTESAVAAIDAGIDLIVLTGAASTGRAVLRQAASTLTPTIMELSGCDAVVVLPDADVDRVADLVVFALHLNGGASCIGPRRIIAEPATADRLRDSLVSRLIVGQTVIVHPSARGAAADAIERSIASGGVAATDGFCAETLRQTGRMPALVLDHVKSIDPIASADIFAPVTSILRVDDICDAVRLVNECPYRLAASVFGDRKRATEMAHLLSVGSVSINDLIVPTADPRVPFGGRGSSGFGVTRGDEGLRAMSVPKVIAVRRGKWMPHLRKREESDYKLLASMMPLIYGTMADRWNAMKRMM